MRYWEFKIPFTILVISQNSFVVAEKDIQLKIMMKKLNEKL